MSKFFKGLFERSKITRNTTPKIASILFSIVFYIFVMGEVNPEVEKNLNNLKVELLNIEELENSGLVFKDQNEFTVDVKIAGKKNDLTKVSLEDVKVSADLSGAKQGDNIRVLKVSNPVNIEIKEMTPQQINVRLDKIVQTQKPVEIVYSGEPAKGYQVGSYEISPNEILIEGPASKIESVVKVIAEIDVEGAKENIRKNVPIKAVDGQGNDIIGVDVKTENANVYLSLVKLKNVPITPIINGTVKEGYKITNVEIEPANTTVRAKEGIVNSVTEILTKSINVDELSATLETEVNLDLPKYIETPYLQGLPSVRVEVEKIETKEFTFKANEISINNLNDTLTTNIGELDQDVKVKISDVRSILEDVTRSELELILDAEGLEEGTYTLVLQLNKSGRYENIEIAPDEIEIEVYNKADRQLIEEADAPIDEETNEDSDTDTSLEYEH